MAGLMSFLLYAAVLTVSVTSVLLGLDWLASPPPAPVKHVQIARTTAPIIAPAPKPVAKKPDAKVVAKTAVPQSVDSPPAAAPVATAVPAAQPVASAVTPAAPTNVASVAPNAPSTTAQADQSETSPVAQGEIAAAPQPPAPRCDVQACSRAYVSFNAADCTWQPYDGPRRFCDKGTPPPAASVAGGDSVAQTPAVAPSQAQARAPSCNVQACSRAYLSFDATDCTWQPYEGPRQLCEK